MSDDGKKILNDLENGKLPDIETNTSEVSKDLSRVRYNRSFDHDMGRPSLETLTHYMVLDVKPKKKQNNRTSRDVVTKERKKVKSGKK